jgi:hypothetical protein
MVYLAAEALLKFLLDGSLKGPPGGRSLSQATGFSGERQKTEKN